MRTSIKTRTTDRLQIADCRLQIPATTSASGGAVLSAVSALLALVPSLVLFVGCGSEPSPASTESTSAPRVEATVGGDLGVLTGRWQRPDGGYVLEIANIASDGRVQATYFNPQPIQISTAQAEWWQGAAQLFVEFDDVNYRGSTYQLIHEPERDILFGTYFQAAMGQTFEVVFVRLR